MADNVNDSPIQGGVGAEADVESLAESITSREITAILVRTELPIAQRKAQLLAFIEELNGRKKASKRGEDLEPLLRDARIAIRILDHQEPTWPLRR